MLFARGGKAFRGLFATHPPIEERISALDASFKGKPRPFAQAITQGAEPDSGLVSNLAGAAIVDRAGTVSPEELAFAQALHQRLPEELTAAAHSLQGAVLLVIALVLDPEPTRRAPQITLLEQKIGPARAGRCGMLADELVKAGVETRLPLLEMSFPTLKERPNEQILFVLELTEELVRLDGRLHVFEYVIVRLLKSYFRISDEPARNGGRLKDSDNQSALTKALQVVAHHGHTDEASAAAAVHRGLAALGLEQSTLPASSNDLDVLDEALDGLRGLTTSDRRLALIAVHASIAHDGKITMQESELFRAVAAGLGCPLPPLVLDSGYVK